MLSLPSIFGDRMVLQRGAPIPIWGRAEPGSRVAVEFGGDQAAAATADAEGCWRLTLPARPAELVGGALTIRSGDERLEFVDVVVGEVWLCSGQSNMEMSVEDCALRDDPAIRIPDAGVRFIKIVNTMADAPCMDCGGSWRIGTPDSVRALTAIGFHFAARVGSALAVPVGIIHCAWGCSSAEAWTSRAALEADHRLSGIFERHAALVERFPRDRADFAMQMDAWYALNAETIPDAAARCRGLDDGWASPDLVADGWQAVARPFLRPAGIPTDADAVVWFRREVVIPPAWTGGARHCDLGIIDGQATVFIDGAPIWEKTDRDPFHWLKPCAFDLPLGAVGPGRHLLAVRIVLQFCAGSRYDVERAFRLFPGDDTASLPLGDGWTSRLACLLPRPEPTRLRGAPPWPAGAPWDMRRPGRIFNAMIAPLVGYGVKGILWYQGETNVPQHAEYRRLLTTMIRDWRTRWRQDRLWFGIVQLADFGPTPASEDSTLPLLREAQQQVADTVEDCGLATAIDSGEPHDIHPHDKRRPAERLAAWALGQAYQTRGRVAGPRVAACEIQSQAIRVRFVGVVGRLMTRDGKGPASFVLAGADRRYRHATASITGPDSVELRAEGLTEPRHVRYAWFDNPSVNLVDAEGYPVHPFRTDVSTVEDSA